MPEETDAVDHRDQLIVDRARVGIQLLEFSKRVTMKCCNGLVRTILGSIQAGFAVPVMSIAAHRPSYLHRYLAIAMGLSAPLLALPSRASTVQCSGMQIVAVTPEGPRDDAFVFQNSLIIQFAQSCGGTSYSYLPNGSPIYNATLAVALTAFTTGQAVNIAVNDAEQLVASGLVASEIAYVSL